ncbi:MAG: glycoside hydrolase family 37 [Clostridia bacterium]|nr:glycoside hydrolase family 37 [Clostridia bacterium]
MNLETAKKLIRDYCYKNYKDMTRRPSGIIKYPFIVPGSQSYQSCLWDWDSWLTDIAIRQIIEDTGEGEEFFEYEKGCILNFLDHADKDGGIPIVVLPTNIVPAHHAIYKTNMHKPCLLQHLAFVMKCNNDDTSWFADKYEKLEKFIGVFLKNYYHADSGLFFWLDDLAIGVDNDPATFYRPEKSSGSIYFNCLMYKELLAMCYVAEKMARMDRAEFYKAEADKLAAAIREHCWDERDGSFYSVDLNLLPVNPESNLHKGAPRNWPCLIQRIDVWSNFLPLWAGLATKEQAEEMVKNHFANEKTFNAPYGVRTLGKQEKMYQIIKSGNPSCWLGPIWGISNYLVFSGLVKYGFDKEATLLAEKTIMLFGGDIEKCGELHEYYHPETGEGVNNPGFQNWNFLSLNMMAYLEDKKRIIEF